MRGLFKPVPLIIIAILLLILFGFIKECSRTQEQQQFNQSKAKEDRLLRRYDSLLTISNRRFEEYVRCSALNAELRKKEVTNIQEESQQDENNIISQPDVADDELLRKIARQYKAAHPNE